MKKFLLLFFALLSITFLNAQQPAEIYIATWVTMSDLGKPVTPDANDPKLIYNPESGCYEGEVIDWPRIYVNPYNAKIPYSLEGEEITYYGVDGPTQQFSFNTTDTQSFEFTANTNPSSFKGFGLSMQNSQGAVDVMVSMNLETGIITFTKFESGEGSVIPELIGISPENRSELVLNEDGGASITLSFNGEVTNLEAVHDGVALKVESSDSGKVWTIFISPERISEVANSSQGIMTLTVQKVYAGNLPVSFTNGSPVLNLVYSVAGITKMATIEIKGNEKGIETLNIYKYPEYSVGDEFDIEGDEFSFTYSNHVTYLFTVGASYEIEISSDIDSNDGENWKLGTAYSTKKGPNGETTDEKVAEGITLTIYEGSDGGLFEVSVISKEDAGVGSLVAGSEKFVVYGLNGVHLFTTENKDDLNKLQRGIYIINGEKVSIK